MNDPKPSTADAGVGCATTKAALKESMESFVQDEINESHTRGIEQERLKLQEATLENVYKTTEKWLGIKVKDRNRIDVILATAISNKLPGTPIWMFICGNSGDWKSAFSNGLSGLRNVIKVDQLTPNTLASGQRDAHDLGSELQGSDKILLFPDLACLSSMNTDDKSIIWGQFRNLYDGSIYKRTGSGVNKAYEGCHVTLIACTTQAIRDEILIHAQLGTRELIYDTGTDAIDNDFKMEAAMKNEQYEAQMKEEIQKAVTEFIAYHKPKDITITPEIKNFLKKEAQRLAILRATAMVDKTYRELQNPIYPEVPTRLIKQFQRLYRCLMSLDDNYPAEKARQIISHIVDSSGNKVRQLIMNVIQASYDQWFKISDLTARTKIGRNAVKTQLEVLWGSDVVEKEVREERIGGWTYKDPETYEISERGGHVEEVAYYRWRIVS